MDIPKKFKLGTKEVTVVSYRFSLLPTHVYGSFFPEAATIKIATQRPKAKVSETFWHETTHAILYDMKHPLWDDEKFVKAFSKRLHQVIRTAEM